MGDMENIQPQQMDSAAVHKDTPRVVIRIDEKRCKGCDICVQFCKQKCLAMNGFVAVVVNEKECTKCMRCEILCPDFAITVE